MPGNSLLVPERKNTNWDGCLTNDLTWPSPYTTRPLKITTQPKSDHRTMKAVYQGNSWRSAERTGHPKAFLTSLVPDLNDKHDWRSFEWGCECTQRMNVFKGATPTLRRSNPRKGEAEARGGKRLNEKVVNHYAEIGHCLCFGGYDQINNSDGSRATTRNLHWQLKLRWSIWDWS